MQPVLSVFLFLGSLSMMCGQPNIPNGGLENWVLVEGSGPFKDYEEPADGWSSGNGAIHVAPNTDPVLEKSADAHSGDYSAKLVTREIFGQIGSGSLFTGSFSLNLSNPVKSARQGVPFTARPVRFEGWYKYAPSGGDSAVLRATFSKWSGSERVVIGEALMKVYSKVDTWTPFDLVVSWESGDSPDTVAVVFASSAGGEFFKGDVGSTLWVDDLSFAYESVSVREAPSTTSYVTWNTRFGHVVVDARLEGQLMHVYDLFGREVVRVPSIGTVTDLSQLHHGVYVVAIGDVQHTILR